MNRKDRDKQTRIENRSEENSIPAGFVEPAGFVSDAPIANLQASRVISVQETRSGPLPSPEVLARYEELTPGTSERIIRMAEAQAAHRMAMEKPVISGNVAQQNRGPLYGFVLALTAMAGGIWLISSGHSATGLTAIMGPVAGLAGVFVYGKKKQQGELQEKKADLDSRLGSGRQEPGLQRKTR